MESTSSGIVSLSIRKLSFRIKDNAKNQIPIQVNKKVHCDLDNDRNADKLFIQMEVTAKSVKEGLFSFSAECRAIISANTHDISNEELKEQIHDVYVPMVDQLIVEKIKQITTEMGQAPLDLTTVSTKDQTD